MRTTATPTIETTTPAMKLTTAVSALGLLRLLSASTVLFAPSVVESFTFPSSATTTTCHRITNNSNRRRRRRTCRSNGEHNDISNNKFNGQVIDSVAPSITWLQSSSTDTTEKETAASIAIAAATDLKQNVQDFSQSVWLAAEPLFSLLDSDNVVAADAQQETIVKLCDEIHTLKNGEDANTSSKAGGENDDPDRFRISALELRRYQLLAKLLRSDYDAYVATASFLSPGLIPREDLPNVQDVPHPQSKSVVLLQQRRQQQQQKQAAITAMERPAAVEQTELLDEFGRPLVPDCTVPDEKMGENFAEAVLLEITRNLYAGETGQPRNEVKGILGLMEEMRVYMLSPQGADPAEQQRVLLNTLYKLMTPVLPPFYRIFMGWKVPSAAAGDPDWLVDLAARVPKLEPGRQYGPAFYAPLLTSVVAPLVFGFLVGPARVNLRSDGLPGGLVVNKCKFLQESNCKGMCLHSCKLPAERLFDELGLPLRVSPNFDSQECQWSFGEAAPEDLGDDETWPQGCLSGCGTRQAVAQMRRSAAEEGGSVTEVANCY